jgi:hypothetical protein
MILQHIIRKLKKILSHSSDSREFTAIQLIQSQIEEIYVTIINEIIKQTQSNRQEFINYSNKLIYLFHTSKFQDIADFNKSLKGKIQNNPDDKSDYKSTPEYIMSQIMEVIINFITTQHDGNFLLAASKEELDLIDKLLYDAFENQTYDPNTLSTWKQQPNLYQQSLNNLKKPDVKKMNTITNEEEAILNDQFKEINLEFLRIKGIDLSGILTYKKIEMIINEMRDIVDSSKKIYLNKEGLNEKFIQNVNIFNKFNQILVTILNFIQTNPNNNIKDVNDALSRLSENISSFSYVLTCGMQLISQSNFNLSHYINPYLSFIETSLSLIEKNYISITNIIQFENYEISKGKINSTSRELDNLLLQITQFRYINTSHAFKESIMKLIQNTRDILNISQENKNISENKKDISHNLELLEAMNSNISSLRIISDSAMIIFTINEKSFMIIQKLIDSSDAEEKLIELTIQNIYTNFKPSKDMVSLMKLRSQMKNENQKSGTDKVLKIDEVTCNKLPYIEYFIENLKNKFSDNTEYLQNICEILLANLVLLDMIYKFNKINPNVISSTDLYSLLYNSKMPNFASILPKQEQISNLYQKMLSIFNKDQDVKILTLIQAIHSSSKKKIEKMFDKK